MTAAPVRIRRERTKGWRAPDGAIYVGRGSRWGNPIVIGSRDARTGGIVDPSTAVERYLDRLVNGRLRFTEADVREQLRGHDLICWCPLTSTCHADVLLEIAREGRDA